MQTYSPVKGCSKQAVDPKQLQTSVEKLHNHMVWFVKIKILRIYVTFICTCWNKHKIFFFLSSQDNDKNVPIC